jgi:lipopolysaccharide heptosyltransferase II
MRSNPALKSGDALLGRAAFALLRLGRRARRGAGQEAMPGDAVRTVVAIKLCCLGDGILAVPALRALKLRWPKARLLVLCTSRSSPAFEDLGFIDELHSLPITGFAGIGEMVGNTARLWGILGKIKRQRPDVAVDLDLYYKATPVMAYLTGAPVRAGFDIEGLDRAGLFTHSAPRDRNKWEVECFLDIIRAIGIDTRDTRLEFNMSEQARSDADQILGSQGIGPQDPFIALCPGSSKNWPAKQWPVARFAEVADWAWKAHGLPSVVIGAGFERELGEEVVRHARGRTTNVAGDTSVQQTAALLARARALVTNDTGPLHLATAVGTPVVAIFGPTNVGKWGPRGARDVVITDDSCPDRPCYYLSYMPDCEHRKCLTQIPAQRVIDALQSILST